MSYYHNVRVEDGMAADAYKRRRDTCYGKLLGFVDCGDVSSAEIYYDIDEHRQCRGKEWKGKEEKFDAAYAYLSIKFTDRKTSNKYQWQKIVITPNAMRKITDVCVKYIQEDPVTERSLFCRLMTHITSADTEIAQLKALLDQHHIAY